MNHERKQPKKEKKKKSKPIPASIRDRCLVSFQKLRRIQEANDEGYVTCISCGKKMHWKEAQGGHYISRTQRATEIEHDNVYPQCPQCNGYLHGNPIPYRMNLVRKIGEERVKRIENMAASAKGDEEATAELSPIDQIEAVRKKNKQYYFDKKKEFDAEIIRLLSEKGL